MFEASLQFAMKGQTHGNSALVQVMHYNAIIMSAMASQITSLTIVYSTVYTSADQRKHQSSTSLAFVQESSLLTSEFPTQIASNMENVSIWWHHVLPTALSNLDVLEWNFFASLKFVQKGQTHRNSALIQVMAWLYIGNKLLPNFREAIWHHKAMIAGTFSPTDVEISVIFLFLLHATEWIPCDGRSRLMNDCACRKIHQRGCHNANALHSCDITVLS